MCWQQCASEDEDSVLKEDWIMIMKSSPVGTTHELVSGSDFNVHCHLRQPFSIGELLELCFFASEQSYQLSTDCITQAVGSLRVRSSSQILYARPPSLFILPSSALLQCAYWDLDRSTKSFRNRIFRRRLQCCRCSTGCAAIGKPSLLTTASGKTSRIGWPLVHQDIQTRRVSYNVS